MIMVMYSELGNKKSTNMETAQEDSDEEYSSYEEEDADYEDFVQDYVSNKITFYERICINKNLGSG
jgi:hypothetical protein